MKTKHPMFLFRPSSAFRPLPHSHLPKRAYLTRLNHPRTHSPTRQFVLNPLTPLQTLTASRILPYHAAPLFDLIADISSYPQFIPHCTSSTITSYSSTDSSTSRTWPRTADLKIGYGPYDELFRSAVYCLPYTVLEAVAGDAEPTIPRSQLPHYYNADFSTSPDPEKSSGNSAIFSSLLTRWTLREYPFKPAPPDGSSPQEGEANKQSASPRTEVNLHIEVQFASAVYSALSQAVAPKVAGMMVEAFEKRAREVLGKGHGVEEEMRSKSGLGVESAGETVQRGAPY